MEMLSKKELIRKIANHELSAEEGARLLAQMSHTGLPAQKAEHLAKKEEITHKIAIIGMSGKFADAENVEEYWDTLIENRSAIRDIPEERSELQACTAQEREYIQKGGFLERITLFDPLFFHISPKEAEYMDPRQKLFLEESWKAIAARRIFTKI